MKKGLILLLCLFTALSFILAGCDNPEAETSAESTTAPKTESEPETTQEPTPEPEAVAVSDILAAAEAALVEPPASASYTSDGNEIDSSTLVSMFCDKPVFDDEFNVIIPAAFKDGTVKSYAFHIPKGKNAVEIDILLASNSSGLETIKALCQFRLDYMKSDKNDVPLYDPSASAIIDKAEIYVKGNYVILLATPDNETVKEAINAVFS